MKYPYVNFDDVVFTDTTRVRNGALYTGGAPVNGYRLIGVRIFRPAQSAGSGKPIKVSVEPKLYNGTYANQPLVTSTMAYQETRTWSNNKPLTQAFPLILLFGGGGTSPYTLRLAETIAAAGFIVAVPSGYGVDNDTCPRPDFCATAVARTQDRDARTVINAAAAGLLGFSGNQVKTDNNGLPIVGCIGGSAGGSVCVRAAGGATSVDANSLPGETQTDARIRAVLAGDSYPFPAANFNNENFKAVLGTFASGLFSNWPGMYPIYDNASKRIFYDLKSADHNFAAFGTAICDEVRESIRVIKQGVNTPRDDLSIKGHLTLALSGYFSQCDASSLKGFEVLPQPIPSNLKDLRPFAPLAGVLLETNGSETEIINYYATQFMDGILNGNAQALKRATTNSFTGLVDNIYVDGVPGSIGNNFTLQNKQIDFKLDKNKKNYITTIVTRNAPIADPSLEPGAYSLFGDNDWEDETVDISDLGFGSYPFPKDNLISKTRSIGINANGFLLPESTIGLIDGGYAPRRFANWFANRGSWTIACAGTDMTSVLVDGDPVGGRIWVSNTPQRLKVTWYKVGSYEHPDDLISVQCSLFPDGSVQIVNDDSIPPVLVPDNATGAMLVGISSGRLHVKNGTYEDRLNPKIVTFTDILNGASTKNADGIFEEYRESRDPQGNQPASCSNH